MKRTFSITIVILGFLLAFSSCGSTKILSTPHDPDASIIIISSFTKLEEVVLENVETHQQYASTPFKSNRTGNRIFYNIPSGTYRVVRVKMWLQVVNSIMTFTNFSDELSEYFGPIEIEPSSKYFLGVFRGYYKGFPSEFNVRNHIKFEYVDPANSIIDEIREAVSKSDWKDGEFIMLRPAKYTGVFDFY